MRAEPFIDGDGVSHERERAAYRPVIVTDRDGGLVVVLLPPESGDRLTCLEFARVFGLRLNPGTSADEAAELAALIERIGAGWEAIYDDPEPRWPPSFPNVVPLKVRARVA